MDLHAVVTHGRGAASASTTLRDARMRCLVCDTMVHVWRRRRALMRQTRCSGLIVRGARGHETYYAKRVVPQVLRTWQHIRIDAYHDYFWHWRDADDAPLIPHGGMAGPA